MTNELLLVVTAIIDIAFIFIVARLNPGRLYGVVALNLFFVAIFGSKLITVFGLTTNVGNVFYACVFLATHLIIERGSRKDGLKAIWFGVAVVIFLTTLSQITVHFISATPADVADTALRQVFALSLRVTLASLVAYIFAQYINVIIYSHFKDARKKTPLWFRCNLANISSQLVDSCIFFSIAFIDLPGKILVSAIIAGWIIKTGVVMLGTPVLYLDTYFQKK